MRVTSGIPEVFSAGVLPDIYRYRHRVFVEQLGWDLHTKDGLEQDQFDRSDTVYVVAQDEEGSVSGCARLLPTNRPYLLGEVFPQLLNGLIPPCSHEIWELSRFAAVDFNNQTTSALNQFSSPVAIELLRESISCAARHGAKHIITVSPIGVERLLRKAGFHAHRAGPPMIIDGHAIFACWIELE
jgi:N-acyl-L-homoserine lactone synthetase